MSEIVSTFICDYCPRPDGQEYEDYKGWLGRMTEQEYLCPKCGVCRSCGPIYGGKRNAVHRQTN